MLYTIGDREVTTTGNYFVAPNATIIGSVVLENNANIWFNSVIRGDSDVITIGENCNVQDACVLHTDAGIKLTLHKGASVGHKAMLHGCDIGENSLVGINAIVLNHAVIGKNCLIGANSLIPEGKEIPDGSLVVGSPGRVVRSLKPEEIDRLKATATHYVARAEQYRQTFKKQT